MRRSGLWRNPDFLKLWAGESVSLLGSQVTLVALPLLAALTLGASPLGMAALSAAATIPVWVLNLPAGAWVDRARRRPIMLGANVGRALLLGSIPLAALLGRLGMGQLYLVAFLTGALAVFFNLAYQAYLPSLVGRGELVEGNAKLEVSNSVAQVAGPAAAGMLVSLLTAPLAIALDALSFAVSAACVALIRRPEPEPAAGGSRNVPREVWEGLRFVVRHSVLRTLTGVTALGNVFSGALFALHILFMARVLGLSPGAIGVVLSMAGPGALAGALLVGRLARPLSVGRTLICGQILFTAGDFLLALAGGPRPLAVAMLALSQALIGLGSPIYNVTAISLRQSLTPDRLLGRVTASARLVAVGTLPLGALLGGALGQTMGLRPALLAAALGMLVPLTWLALSPVYELAERPAPGKPSGAV
jgi:MFS family permease